MKGTQLLHNEGQSLWLDNITRDSEEVLAEFGKAGIDVDALAAQLQAEGA
jgi:hypothetical protein